VTAQVGDEVGPLSLRVTRADLVRYAGAALDFNPIHWNERIATSVGLPDVIAHGMLVMALGGRLVTDWTGDPGAVVEYSVRFSRPIPVPDDDTGARVEFTGSVKGISDDIATVAITARCEGRAVFGKAIATVRVHS
jgi:acyl dehydratase